MNRGKLCFSIFLTGAFFCFNLANSQGQTTEDSDVAEGKVFTDKDIAKIKKEAFTKIFKGVAGLVGSAVGYKILSAALQRSPEEIQRRTQLDLMDIQDGVDPEGYFWEDYGPRLLLIPATVVGGLSAYSLGSGIYQLWNLSHEGDPK